MKFYFHIPGKSNFKLKRNPNESENLLFAQKTLHQFVHRPFKPIERGCAER